MIKCLVFEHLRNICPTKGTNDLLYSLDESLQTKALLTVKEKLSYRSELLRKKSDATQFRSHKSTGKSLSEALIFASINPHFDNRLFMVIP
jgi:hypothetical protein